MSVTDEEARGGRNTRTPQMLRLITIGVIVAVVALSAFADRSPRNRPAAVTVTAMPVAGPDAALSSSWFCAGPGDAQPHQADGRLVVANASARALRGTVTLVPSTGSVLSQELRVGPNDRVTIPERPAGGAPYLGALVELDGGQAAVEQVVTGSSGTSSTACATTGSTRWYFAAGTTQESSTLSLSLLNPYPDDAIADLSFTTEQGQETPQDFQGILVPARTVVGFDLGTHLRRRASVATTVTLRIGRVVAFETQVVLAQNQAAAATGAPGATPWPPGVSVVRGAPSPGTSWWWPAGGAGDGLAEQYVIYNPNAAEAQVSLGVDLDQGSADPFQVSVDPHGVAVVATNAESRIPKGSGHAAGLRSTNGVGVVAERIVLASAPSGQSGLTEVLGSRLQARRWLVPGDGATDAVNPTMSVYNPAPAPVTVSISSLNGALTPVDGQAAVTIPGHHRYILLPKGPGAAPALVVDAQGPVVVESDTSPTRGMWMDDSVGVPLSP